MGSARECWVFELSAGQISRSLHALEWPLGQVAQSVERGPEKAGVGGSIPSLATKPRSCSRNCDATCHSARIIAFHARRVANRRTDDAVGNSWRTERASSTHWLTSRSCGATQMGAPLTPKVSDQRFEPPSAKRRSIAEIDLGFTHDGNSDTRTAAGHVTHPFSSDVALEE